MKLKGGCNASERRSVKLNDMIFQSSYCSDNLRKLQTDIDFNAGELSFKIFFWGAVGLSLN